MISRDQVIDLLKLVAVYDQRTVGEEDVRGWLLVARTAGWHPRAATRVIVEHYSRGADRPRITPAQITDGLSLTRRHAAASFEAPVIPPELVSRDYPQWYRARLDAHIARVVDAWADGHPIPTALPTPQPQALDPAVKAAITRVAETTRIPGADT